MSGEPGAQLQQLQIVVEGQNVKVGGRDARLFKGIQQLQIGGGVGAGHDEVGFRSQKQLHVGGLGAADVGYLLPQGKLKGGPGVVGRRHQGVLSPRQTPDVGEAADHRRYPLGLIQGDFPAQGVGEGNVSRLGVCGVRLRIVRRYGLGTLRLTGGGQKEGKK